MNKNKKIIIISIIILLIVAIIGFIFIYNSNNKNDANNIKKQKTKFVVNDGLKFEINSEVSNKEFLEEKDGYEVVEEEKIDTSKLGENKYLLKLHKDDKQFEQEIVYIIQDTIEPIIEADLEVALEQGQEFKVEEHAHATDNSNEEIHVTTEGEYDINKVGEYNLKYIAKDSSNNIASIDFKLIVKEKQKTQNNSSNKPNNSNNNSNNNTKPNNTQNSNKPTINYDEGISISDSQAESVYNKYYNQYRNKYTTKQESFSPEKYVTIKTIDTPVRFHYEWFIDEQKWQFIDDSGYIPNPKDCQKIYPAPNRAGKETTYEENGITYYTGEKTQVYSLYGYSIYYDDGYHKYF